MPAQPTPPSSPGRRSASPEAVSRLAGQIARKEPFVLRAWAVRLGAPRDELDDVVQSALLNFIRFYPGDAGDYGGAKRYLYSCVASAAYKARRRSARRLTIPLPDRTRMNDSRLKSSDTEQVSDGSVPSTEELALDRLVDDEARELLGQLPPDQLACLAMSAAGFGPAETAKRLGLSERQVRKRIQKANAKLRALS